MKNSVKFAFSILISIIFLPIGRWLNTKFSASPHSPPPFAIINIICLTLWMNFAFIIKNKNTNTSFILIFMHILPAIIFIITVYFEFVIRSFAVSPLNNIIQFYYLPLIWVKLPSFGASLSSTYFSAFLTLLLSCFIGIKVKETFITLK